MKSLEFGPWFKNKGRDLWTLVKLFSEGGPEEAEEDFYQILQVVRAKWPEFQKESDILRRFFAECVKRGLERRNPEWSAQVLFYAPFGLGWKLDEVAAAFRVPQASVRFRMFDFFRRRHHEILPKKVKGRECLRFDLFAVDWILNQIPSNSAGVITPALIERHLKHCPRCQVVSGLFKKEVQALQKSVKPLLPAALMEWSIETNAEPVNSRSRWAVTAWPVQIALVLVLLGGVLMAPQVRKKLIAFKEQATQPLPASPPPLVVPVAPVVPSNPSSIVSLDQAAPAPETPFSMPLFRSEEPFFAHLRVPEMLVPWTPVPQPKSDSLPQDAEIQASSAPVAPPPVSVATLAPPPPAPVSPVSEPAAPALNPPTLSPTPSLSSSAQGQKFFYRWGAFSQHLPEHRSQLLEILTKYRAQPAGDLPLGADHLGGNYYHFSLEAASYEALIVEVERIGLIEFTRQRAESSRVTAPGKTRVVFLIRPR